MEQHYLISLRRTPERLWAWVGAQSVHGFPFKDTTLYYGVDYLDYPTHGDLYQFLVDVGVDFAKKGVENKSFASQPLKDGALAVFASKWVLFNKIAQMPDSWYGVWSDDAILALPYRVFEDAIRHSEEFEIIAPYVGPHRNCPDIWLNKQFVDERSDLYQGFIGYGETMFMVRPSGAKQFLDVQTNHFHTWLDTLGSHHNDEFRNVATFAYPYIKEHVNISGIQTTKHKEFSDGILRVPVFNQVLNNAGNTEY